MKKLSYKVYSLKPEGFASGRIIRNYFERTKMIQSVGVFESNLSTEEDLMAINHEDLWSLRSELENESKSKQVKIKQGIGFVG